MTDGFKAYIKEVKDGTYPSAEHTYAIADDVIENCTKVRKHLRVSKRVVHNFKFHADALSLGSARSGTKLVTTGCHLLSTSVLQRSALKFELCTTPYTPIMFSLLYNKTLNIERKK